MHVHILGIAGTFMAGIATVARALGHHVTGADQAVYPPMSLQLDAAQIAFTEGWDPAQLDPAPDLVVIGNALSRGNPAVEAVLERGLPYTSGPAWLREQVLHSRHVLAVAGTHGKTTTSSLLAWILEQAGLEPGFLIGGVPENFGASARCGAGRHFVIEADEYDTAFFDKRSKFVHYRPRTLILNNLEFDHADIFDDLDAIKRQFHYLVRTVPGSGLILSATADAALEAVLQMGCWSNVQRFGAEGDWAAQPLQTDASRFTLLRNGEPLGEGTQALPGRHNMLNAVAAIAAAAHVGVAPATALAALAEFRGVARRLTLSCEVGGIRVYDDFAHHPTAIRCTLEALRARVGSARIIAALDLRSNSMRMGVHRDRLAAALAPADHVLVHAPADLGWDPREIITPLGEAAEVLYGVDSLLRQLRALLRAGDEVLLMSNGSFGGIHGQLERALRADAAGRRGDEPGDEQGEE